MRARAVGGTLFVLGTVGCSILTSLDGLETTSSTDASTADAASADGSPDAPVDAPPPIPDVPIPPTCKTSNLRCVSAPPSGWSPPFVFYSGASAPPACPADAPLAQVTANVGLGAVPPAQCAACSCNATKIACAPAKATAFATTACSGACSGLDTTGTLSDNGKCFGFKCNGNVAPSIYLEAPLLTAMCTPQAAKPTATLTPPTWTTKLLGCRAPNLAQVDCAAGELCATKAGAPFATTFCISKDGDVACPAGPYSKKQTLAYADVTDTRDCGSCACGAVSGTCAATVQAYTSIAGQCQAAVAAPKTVPTCITQGSGSGFLYKATVPGTASCPASGGAPTGTIVPSKPVTICCEP